MSSPQYPPATAEQQRAWSFYGVPRVAQKPGKAAPVTTASSFCQPGQQVGEVRYVVGWLADQLVRMGWRVTVGGSETWAIANKGETIVSNSEQSDTESPEHPANASRRLLSIIMWDSRTVREVTTNLFVAGELHYALDKGAGPGNADIWRVVSVIRSDRDEILDRCKIKVHGIWPHPADPEAADAPLFGVLTLLDDMAWLSRLSRSQSANRVGMRGIIGVADSFKTMNGASGEGFWDDFQASLSREMDDPSDVSPVGLIGAAELVKPEGDGMMGLKWLIPEFPYDDKVDSRMEKLVQRLAYGLPIPPEILLGMQAQSKATAFQVEGATYRAHIEPIAMLIAKVAADALRLFLPNELGDVEVVPDPTFLLARRHSVSDAFEAFDRGVVGFSYLREVLGIPERAAMTEEDLELKERLGGSTEVIAAVTDPANGAAEEPITAAAAAEEGPEALAEQLERIDAAAFYELVGAAQQAVVKGRERLGARIRSSSNGKASIPAGMTNAEVGERYASAAIDFLGEDGARLVEASLESVLSWWETRLESARQQAKHVLAKASVEVAFSEEAKQRSVDLLRQALSNSITTGEAFVERDLRPVLEAAGAQA